MPARKWIPVAGAWLVVGVAGLAVFYHLRNQPFYHDANGYVLGAEGIRAQGLVSEWFIADIRSYGYPWALSGALRIADVLDVGRVVVIFALQWSAFVGAAWLAANSLFRSPRTRLIGFVAVAANPLLVVYTPQALTESVTLTCILLSTAALGRAIAARLGAAKAAWLVVGALSAGFALAVRPGNLMIPVCYLVAVGVLLVGSRSRQSWLATSASVALVLVSVALPVAPQAVINWHNYRVASILPVTDIAAFQSEAGLHNIRYATNVSTCGEAPLFFPNPLAAAVPAEPTQGDIVRYYALDWPDGPETAAMHVFSGLDPRPFLTYQVSYGVWYERILQALTVALLGLAVFGLARAPWSRSRVTPAVLFLGMATFFSLAILATSQAELRFGTVLVTAVSILAASGVAHLRRPSVRAVLVVGLAFAATTLAWFTVSDLMLAMSPQWVACR